MRECINRLRRLASLLLTRTPFAAFAAAARQGCRYVGWSYSSMYAQSRMVPTATANTSAVDFTNRFIISFFRVVSARLSG